MVKKESLVIFRTFCARMTPSHAEFLEIDYVSSGNYLLLWTGRILGHSFALEDEISKKGHYPNLMVKSKDALHYEMP